MDTLLQPPPPVTEAPWQAHPGPQTEFLSLWQMAYEGLFGGAKGPGKTDCLVMEATRQVSHPRYRGMVFRRTFPQLQEIMDRMMRWYPRIGGIWRGDERRWVFPGRGRPIHAAGGVGMAEAAASGSVGVSHLQHEGDKYNHQGREYHGVFFDQLEQFTETQYLYILAQQRRSVPDLYCYARGTANPGGVGHAWVKRRFILPGPRKFVYDAASGTTRVFIPATLEDNPSLMVNDPGYEGRLRLLGDSLYRAFRWGDWDSFEGQFFSMWDPKVHVLPHGPVSPYWTRFASLDYGYSAPSSVGWWANDHEGGIVRYREIYKEQLTYTDLAHLILEKNAGERLQYLVADPAIWSDISHHVGDLRGQTGYEIMQKVFDEDAAVTGRPVIRIIKADNDRINGWIRMREMLNPVLSATGQLTARMRVMDHCEFFIRTLPEQIHDTEGANPEDLDTSGEDHAVDEGRYAAMSRPKASPWPAKQPTPTDSFWKAVRTDVQRSYQADIQADHEAEEDAEIIVA